MDLIFRGALMSPSIHFGVKKALLEKTVLSAAQYPDAKAADGVLACHQIFDVALDYAGRLDLRSGSSTATSNQILCRMVFCKWAEHHSEHLYTFLEVDTFRHYLSSTDYAINRCGLLELLTHAVQLLSHEYDVSALTTAILVEAPSLLLEDENLNLATPLLDFWSRFGHDWCGDVASVTSICKALLHCLSRCDVTSMTSPCGSVEVADFVGRVWADCGEPVIRECLAEIYKILSSTATSSTATSELLSASHYREPSQCLAPVAQYIPLDLLQDVCKSMVLTNGAMAAMTLQLVLCRVVDWLQWPIVKNVDAIIMNIMKMLENNKSYAILFLATQLKAEQIFLLLKCEHLRDSCINVIMYMLLAYQHSPDVFHKVIVRVPEVLGALREENSESSLAVAEKVTAMVFALMQLHSGFPEIYDPVLPVLKDISTRYVKMIQEFMATNKWGSFGLNYSSHCIALQPKSTTGKVGLVNLGNTCYMNSVLQAVYMNDEFRYRVLTAMLAPQQQLLFQLQRVFTFLTHSERPSYSPKGFLQASKPPWFDVGRQQDCSEFLRHFFDSMHEQECLGSTSLKCFPTEPSSSSGAAKPATVIGGGPSASAKSEGRCPSPRSSPLRDSLSSSSAASSASETPATAAQCLIHELFSGQLSTSYRCLQCQQVSVQHEAFIDLSLALPECSSRSKYIQKKELKAGRAEPADSEVHLGECSSSSGAGQAQLLEVEDHGEGQPDAATGMGGADEEDLNLEDLIRYFISPEKLEGENRYFCANCDTLQEAQKTIRITAAPKYLTCTILRFAYDVQTQQRVKILRNVVYPEVLSIPVATGSSAPPPHDDKEASDAQVGAGNPVATDFGRPHLYALYAVVVHSGASSDCGHYYTYGCRSESLPDAFRYENTENDETATPGGSGGGSRRVWYLFNDSRVTYSEYQSFANLSQRFARDTAYLLFYRRVGSTVDARLFPGSTDPKQIVLRKDLEEVVQHDNLLYAQELEEAMLAAQKKSSSSGAWHDFDDQNPPGNCGGGGGLGSFKARFVC